MKITRVLIVVILAATMFAPKLALADDSQLFGACQQAPNSTFCQSKGTKTNPVNRLIKVVADIVALITGAAAMIVIILGGLTMATSGGNAEAVTNARKRIFTAVIGLVIVALAWTIITFATNKLITT